MKTKSTEANELRCTASEIIVMLYEAKQTAQLRLLAAHAKAAIEGIDGGEHTDGLADMLPSEIVVRLGQIHEGYPASEQHTKCALLITQLRRELEKYEESRPMNDRERAMIDAGYTKLTATPPHEHI